jgi:hypothetical protein
VIGTPEINEKVWALPECLDQGNEGACVGYGWTHELYAEPDRVVGVDPKAVYHRAQQLDDRPGEAYSGTSVLAGAKTIQELGHLVEYRWALDVQDVLATLSVHGPVVIGVNWHQGMENVDHNGFVHVTGPVRGGHCVILRGVISDPTSHGWVILGKNSWGPRWGREGDFKLTALDLEKLLKEDGEVCVPVVRVREPAPTPVPTPVPTPEPTPEPTPDPGFHPAVAQLLELFAYEHLPEHLQAISKQFHDLAWNMAQQPTQRGAEQTTCLRKLLEAKDCAVRMGVPLGEIGSNSPPLPS